MKKVSFLVIAAAVAAMFVGCASVQVADKAQFNDMEGDAIAHVNSQNWGLYFLNVPMFTGSSNEIGSISCFNEDSVNVGAATKVLTAKAKELGAKEVTDVQSQRSSIMLPFPFPFLFYIKEVNVSGNAVR